MINEMPVFPILVIKLHFCELIVALILGSGSIGYRSL